MRNLLRLRTQMREAFTDNKILSIEPKRVTLNSADELFIQQTMESIEANMTNAEFTIEDLCRDVAMSRMQLYRNQRHLPVFRLMNLFAPCA